MRRFCNPAENQKRWGTLWKYLLDRIGNKNHIPLSANVMKASMEERYHRIALPTFIENLQS